jgi:hypothetical protein
MDACSVLFSLRRRSNSLESRCVLLAFSTSPRRSARGERRRADSSLALELIWVESGDALKEAVVRARIAERPFADEALRDLDLNGRYSRFAVALVLRLARELAEEMASL